MHSDHQNPEFLIRTLADFRYELRRFYQFSEDAVHKAGLQPRQYQLLLQVAAASSHTTVTIAWLAERLGLKHNSTVELVDRSEHEGLVARTEDTIDRRRIILRVTRKGNQLLSRLAGQHAREITEAAPRLVRALEHISQHSGIEVE